MDSTTLFGLFLVGLSAFLLASHWQRWRQAKSLGNINNQQEQHWREHLVRTTRRRAMASSLVGFVGVTLMAFKTLPQTPRSITAYLLSLVLMTSWILWLACLDLLAGRRFQQERQLAEIAQKLRRAQLKNSNADSAEK